MRSQQQLSYQLQQCSRVNYECSRSYQPTTQSMPASVDFMPMPASAASPLYLGPQIEDVPPLDKCIGQIVLDWEFVHDLDLHLLKVVGATASPAQEPSPEPDPVPCDLCALVDEANNLKLHSRQRLEPVVWYSRKVCSASAGQSTPQAVLQLDRNAQVHSHKPVENLYLTETLDAGVYVVAVHNFSQRQLHATVVGPGQQHEYRSFDEFQKGDPGYQKMEKGLAEQIAHAEDEDGIEKQAIMAKVDQDLNMGSRMVQQKCTTGDGRTGVHYGVTVYTYPEAAANHPQASAMEDLQSKFKSDFFASSDCVFDPSVDLTGYNGASVLADVTSDTGRLALPHKHAAHVALLHVSKGNKARIASVRILAGQPRPGEACEVGDSAGLAGPAGMGAMRAVRRQHMSAEACGRSQPEPELPPQTLQGGQVPETQMLPMLPQSQMQMLPMPWRGFSRSQPEPEMQPQVRLGGYSQKRLQIPPQMPQMQASPMSMQPQMQMAPTQRQLQEQQQQQAPAQMRAQRPVMQQASMPPPIPFLQTRGQGPSQGQHFSVQIPHLPAHMPPV